MSWILWTIAGIYILHKLFPGEKKQGRLDKKFSERNSRAKSSNSLYDIHSRANREKSSRANTKKKKAEWHMPGTTQPIGP